MSLTALVAYCQDITSRYYRNQLNILNTCNTRRSPQDVLHEPVSAGFLVHVVKSMWEAQPLDQIDKSAIAKHTFLHNNSNSRKQLFCHVYHARIFRKATEMISTEKKNGCDSRVCGIPHSDQYTTETRQRNPKLLLPLLGPPINQSTAVTLTVRTLLYNEPLCW